MYIKSTEIYISPAIQKVFVLYVYLYLCLLTIRFLLTNISIRRSCLWIVLLIDRLLACFVFGVLCEPYRLAIQKRHTVC